MAINIDSHCKTSLVRCFCISLLIVIITLSIKDGMNASCMGAHPITSFSMNLSSEFMMELFGIVLRQCVI